MGKRVLTILCLTVSIAFGVRASEISVPDTLPKRDSVAMKKPERVNKHYLSLNTTFFIKQLLSFTNGAVTVTASPYIFEYKMLHKKQGFRIGIGGNLSNQKKTDDQGVVTINKVGTFDVRAGYIYQANISKRWAYFAGVDITGETNRVTKTDNTSVDVVTTSNKAYSIGFGPSFGIQLNFSNRIGVFTESAIYYAYNHGSETTNSSNFPSLNSSSKTEGNSIQFVIPTSIYFFVRF